MFALHAMAVLLLLSVVSGYATGWARWLVERLDESPWTAQGRDDVSSLAYTLLVGTYLHHALRRAYGDGRVTAVLEALALVFACWWLLVAYRVLLFFVAVWTT